jgi:hypothetical protein
MLNSLSKGTTLLYIILYHISAQRQYCVYRRTRCIASSNHQVHMTEETPFPATRPLLGGILN